MLPLSASENRILGGAFLRSVLAGSGVSAKANPLHPFDNAEVPFCACAKRLKRLFVDLALVGGQRYFVTVKFDNDSSLLQACFVGVDFLSRF